MNKTYRYDVIARKLSGPNVVEPMKSDCALCLFKECSNQGAIRLCYCAFYEPNKWVEDDR
jgi:hypothetical protein